MGLKFSQSDESVGLGLLLITTEEACPDIGRCITVEAVALPLTPEELADRQESLSVEVLLLPEVVLPPLVRRALSCAVLVVRTATFGFANVEPNADFWASDNTFLPPLITFNSPLSSLLLMLLCAGFTILGRPFPTV